MYERNSEHDYAKTLVKAMNPFVNPRKRDVSLPSECKDLVDVLRRREGVQRFIRLVLLRAEQDGATELIIVAHPTSGDTPIRYKIADAWYDMSPLPTDIRPDVVSELARAANFQIPGEGTLDEVFDGVRLRWMVAMTSAEEECRLVRIQDSEMPAL